MKVLLDTNIILDIVLERPPFVEHATQLLHHAAQAPVRLFLTATTITDLYYITRKAKGREAAISLIEDLLQLVEIAAVDEVIIAQALQSQLTDFEDAIQEQAAYRAGIRTIITRNEADFAAAIVDVYTPETFLRHFGTAP